MTHEDKKLLLKDLCSRLPYGVICYDEVQKENGIFKTFEYEGFGRIHNGRGLRFIENIKPYLFPLSSMTEEQKKYIDNRWGINEDFDFEIDPNWGRYFVELSDVVDFINWLIENHFDFNGLIPKDLAIDATGLSIY